MEEIIAKKIFSIDIAEDAQGFCYGIIKSTGEAKGTACRKPNMKLLMSELGKRVRKRSAFLHKFPLKEPSPIITLEQDRSYNPRIITPPNGQH